MARLRYNEPIRGEWPPDGWRLFLPLLPWIVAGVLILWLGSGMSYTVSPSEQAVVLRFGKYLATTPPGLHFKFPLVDRVLKVGVQEHGLRLPFGTSASEEMSTDPRRSGEEETLMLTGDLNTASVEWTVQWRVTDPVGFLRRFPADRSDLHAEELITTVGRTVMNRLVGNHSFDEVIGPQREAISNGAEEDIQRILDGYQSGITLTALQMQRVTPPDRVRPAFDRVNASIQEKQKLENEAEATRNQMLPKARAERDKLIREAEGFAARRKAEATGEIESLLARGRAYNRAPDVTRRRLYFEAMQDLYQGVKDKVILDADLKQLLPLLDLTPTAKGGAR